MNFRGSYSFIVFHFCCSIVDNVVLVSGVQQSESLGYLLDLVPVGG